jgi:hypothetical protein
MMRTTNGRALWIIGFLLIASAGIFTAHTVRAAAGPTKENALAAEKELAQAIRTNDADGFFCQGQTKPRGRARESRASTALSEGSL